MWEDWLIAWGWDWTSRAVSVLRGMCIVEMVVRPQESTVVIVAWL